MSEKFDRIYFNFCCCWLYWWCLLLYNTYLFLWQWSCSCYRYLPCTEDENAEKIASVYHKENKTRSLSFCLSLFLSHLVKETNEINIISDFLMSMWMTKRFHVWMHICFSKNLSNGLFLMLSVQTMMITFDRFWTNCDH